MSNPAALLLVDVQVGLDELDYYGGHRNNPDAEANMAKLLSYWRTREFPIIHVKHNSTNPDSPLAPGKPGNSIKSVVQPEAGEPVIEKNVNSAFIGTDLADRLQAMDINKLVIAGLTTEHCISSTVRMAANLGFKVVVVSDATAAFAKTNGNQLYDAQLVHDIELANLSGEFAEVKITEDLLR
ncbi:cysteine hydrolase family protein [Fulvivirga sedimenti]|uniref:Cysteine hydrolase n=1 Tax=Fulvivirga sedimenti TaxID=2879465 RepID=A0A9X1HWB3_9BACT|nr:cysteine hydrolase family protein [Fulvivirga sedimenti]MCA6079125.1 cysteine hydrolase [Fulvivirga sedimenti]